MKRQKPLPPSKSEWDVLPFDVKIHIALQIFFAVEIPRLSESLLRFLRRVDLWLFPPLAFYSTYIATLRNFPDHQIKILAVLATAFMAATLTLFIIRPPRRKQVHWVRL